MCDPATAMMIGSTGMKVVGGISEGKQQKAYYNYSADQATPTPITSAAWARCAPRRRGRPAGTPRRDDARAMRHPAST
jgi:hypothetical protein